jgi:hypothetical protein
MQDVKASDPQDVRASDMENVEASTAAIRQAAQLNVERTLVAFQLSEEALDGTREPDPRAKNAGAREAARLAPSDRRTGRRWPGLVSIVALVFSGISLYETVLKQAALSIYVGGVGHVSWDRATRAEIIALPVTVTNQGARDAVVLDLRLGPDDAPDRYRSSFVGSLYPGQNEPFAPWPVAGHGSHVGVVHFHSKGDAEPLIAPTVSAPTKSYGLCFTAQAVASRPFGLLDWLLERPPTALRLVVEPAIRFSRSDLENGKWIPLWITAIESIDDRRGVQTGTCRKDA